jgi:hypothetical protein
MVLITMEHDQHHGNASIFAHHHPEHEQEHDEHNGTVIVFTT